MDNLQGGRIEGWSVGSNNGGLSCGRAECWLTVGGDGSAELTMGGAGSAELIG